MSTRTTRLSGVWDLRKALGLRKSKGIRIWPLVISLFGLLVNIIVILGYMSSTMRPQYVYRVSHDSLVTALDDVDGTSASDLDNPVMPDYWYWGMYGICAVWNDDESTTDCKRVFPPLLSVPEVDDFSRMSSPDSDSETDPGTGLEIWEEAQKDLDPAVGDKLTPYAQALLGASRRLIIFPLILCIPLAISSLVVFLGKSAVVPKIWTRRIAYWIRFMVDICRGVMVIMAINLCMRYGILLPGLDEESTESMGGEHIGFVYGAAVFKLYILFLGIAAVVGGKVGQWISRVLGRKPKRRACFGFGNRGESGRPGRNRNKGHY